METDADRTSTSRPFVVGSASQQGMRPHQEDAHVEVSNPLFSLVALFDGHGGPVAAKYCAKNLASALEQHMDIANDPKVQSGWIVSNVF
jgi:serine/threonine protein phosphatase PrpC